MPQIRRRSRTTSNRTLVQLAQTRLARQFLTTPGPADPAAVVRVLGAVQAQDYPGAKWALAMRTSGSVTDAAIERAFAAGAILRTHVLRPTWHFVAPEDIRWMLALTGPRIAQAMAWYNRELGLSPDVFRRSHRVIARELRDGRLRTRIALRDALHRAGLGPLDGQRLARVVMDAELAALVCSGPVQGKQFTYALLDERVPASAPRDRDDALQELARRYFATRGPATLRDFSWWSGLTMADCRRAVAIADAALERLTVDDVEHFATTDAWPAARGASAHLLPNYDEFFIGLKDRRAIAQRIGSGALVEGGSALIGHVAFLDGQLVGGWRRRDSAAGVTVELTLLTRISPAERRRLAAAARRFSDFLGAPVTLTERRPTR